MEVFTNVENLRQHPRFYMALGTFDGVHLGHQAIISRTVKQAKSAACLSAVFTFSNHPLSIIDEDRCPPLVVTNQEKVSLIAALGVDVLFNIAFTPEFLRLSAARFIELITDNINLQHITVGANFTYGYRGTGSAATLIDEGKKHHFTVDVVNMVDIDGTVVSSTAIRQLVADGAVKQAAKFLGRPVSVTGKVIKGDQRGRTLGFPTANMAIPLEMLVPADGVYAVHVTDKDGKRHNGIANIGNNPTFSRQTRRIEVHIFDFCDNIYGQNLQVQFIDRIRGEITFASAIQLKEQMQLDVAYTKKMFSSN